jgi:galacturan 1,4-alpha-galacturonidase
MACLNELILKPADDVCSIVLKANSSNILIEDSIFRRGQGIAMGSIGQYPGQYEFVQNFIARNITTISTQ